MRDIFDIGVVIQELMDMFSEFKYSVIVPMYNSEKTIARCIRSVLMQKRDDVELILIDDGSEDQTGIIAKNILKEDACSGRVNYFYTSNAGVSKTRNYGISLAKGRYLLFLDSDDYLVENFFDKLDQAGEHDLLVFGMSSQNKRRYKKCCEIVSGMEVYTEQLTMLLRNRVLLSASNKCFSREMVLKNHLQFPEKLSIGEDFVFALSYALLCTDVFCIKDTLYMVDAENLGSLSRKYRENLPADLRQVYKLTYALIKYADFSTGDKLKLLQCMDYSYAKSVCTCLGELFKVEKPSYRKQEAKIHAVCDVFRRPLSKKAGYVNFLHRVLRLMLFYRYDFWIYLVTYLKKKDVYRKYQGER